MSKLLDQLRQQAIAEPDPFLRSVVEAKICAYLARVGHFDEARAIVGQLRRDHGDGSSPLISAWIMLCEGLLATYSEISPSGRDRVARSQLISCAIGNRELAALSSAWKAHLDFEFSDYGAMFRSLQIATDNMDDGNLAARARFSLVLANVHFLCGDRRGAQTWFLGSRDSAVLLGDQATIDAVIYNRAAFSAGWLRAEACFAEQPAEMVKLVRSELESAMTFQHITQMKALINVVHLSHARVLMLEQRFETALEKLLRSKSDGPFASHNFAEEVVAVEVALCLKRLGRLPETELEKVPGYLESLDALDLDEQMATVWAGIQVLEGTSYGAAVPTLLDRLDKLKTDYRESQRKLLEDLQLFESRLHLSKSAGQRTAQT